MSAVCLALLLAGLQLAMGQQPEGITYQQAADIAKGFAQAVGWTPEGQFKAELRPGTDTYPTQWDISWLRPGRDVTVGVAVATGEVTGGMDFAESSVRPPYRERQGPPLLSEDQALHAAAFCAQVVGLPQDGRIDGIWLKSGGTPGGYQVSVGRYFGEAKYKDDGFTLCLDPNTGALTMVMRKRWGTPPPPPAPINLGQAQAIALASHYLVALGKETSGLNKIELMVIRPPKEPTPGFGHCGEPSRLAWVVTCSRGGAIGPGHIEEAWVDAEDGTLVGYLGCK